MDAAVARHCSELDRCNQRGGRMLSILDLIDADTLDLDSAAFLMATIARGASFLVGARPGGAGKTAVMCALLNLIPPDCEILAATASAVRAASEELAPRKTCYVCHEIGSGPYFAYLWGAHLRAYCALVEKGHILATNLHADDLEEVRSQICEENGVPFRHFNAFHLAVFLRMKAGYGSARRWIDKVYLSNGHSPHKLVFNKTSGIQPAAHDPEWQRRCRAFLERALKAGTRTIEETRGEVVRFLAQDEARASERRA